MILQKLQDDFIKRYGTNTKEIRFFTAPISFSITGSRCENYGGLSLMLSVKAKTTVAVRFRDDDIIKIEKTSDNTETASSIFDLENEAFAESYEYHIITDLYKKQALKTGLEVLYHYDAGEASPISNFSGSGAVTTCFLNTIFNLGLNSRELAKVSQKYSKNTPFDTVASKLASLNAKEQYLLCINCDDYSFEYIPFPLEKRKIIITLIDKKIRQEDDIPYSELMKVLKEYAPNAVSINDVTAEELQKACKKTQPSREFEALIEIVKENDITKNCVSALKQNDIKSFYTAISQKKHKKEFQTILSQAEQLNGVDMAFISDNNILISIIDDDYIDDFLSVINQNAHNKVTFLIVETQNGAEEVPVKTE